MTPTVMRKAGESACILNDLVQRIKKPLLCRAFLGAFWEWNRCAVRPVSAVTHEVHHCAHAALTCAFLVLVVVSASGQEPRPPALADVKADLCALHAHGALRAQEEVADRTLWATNLVFRLAIAPSRTSG